MPANFLSLPGELRNKIYEQLLVLEEPITYPGNQWGTGNLSHRLTMSLLLANKTIHREAISLLYAQNQFDFTSCDLEHVAMFIDRIGHDNARYIQHVSIDFPNFSFLGTLLVPSNLTLKEEEEEEDDDDDDDSNHILRIIQTNCNTLRTLTMSLHRSSCTNVMLDILDQPEKAVEALALANDEFRTIRSLSEIIIKVCEEHGPGDLIIGEMKSHGWVIRTTEHEAGSAGTEVERSFSDIDIDYDRYSYDEETWDDDYDIDNDSDFWRRAGD
jgi:hypothetical protein